MKHTIDVFIAGKPGSKGRPRFSRSSGRAFTPADTLKFENLVRHEIAASMEQAGQLALEGPVIVDMVFIMPEPVGTPKRDRGNGRPHTKKPDLDNLAKLVLDAANTVAFHDDAQVCAALWAKRYPVDREAVGTHVRIYPVRKDDDNEGA